MAVFLTCWCGLSPSLRLSWGEKIQVLPYDSLVGQDGTLWARMRGGRGGVPLEEGAGPKEAQRRGRPGGGPPEGQPEQTQIRQEQGLGAPTAPPHSPPLQLGL